MSKVTLAYEREIDGKKYKPDQSVDLDYFEARALVREGVARWAKEDTPAKEASK